MANCRQQHCSYHLVTNKALPLCHLPLLPPVLSLPAQLRALQEQKAGQVKVVYALRGAFELLDYEDASITDLKRMLLQVGMQLSWGLGEAHILYNQ
jgi:hypothetical protein